MDFNLPIFDQIGFNPIAHPLVQHFLGKITETQKEEMLASVIQVWERISSSNQEPPLSPELQLLALARGARIVRVIRPIVAPTLKSARAESDLAQTLLEQHAGLIKRLSSGSFDDRMQALIELFTTIKLPEHDVTKKLQKAMALIASAISRALHPAPASASSSADASNSGTSQLSPLIHLMHTIYRLAHETLPAAQTAAPALPFPQFEAALHDVQPAVFSEGISGILSEYHYSLSEALTAANGDINKLSPDWRARFDDPNNPVRDITLRNTDVSYRALETLARTCRSLKSITLEGATCNGSPFFDASVIQHFFADRDEEIAVHGAPCIHTKAWLPELMEYSDALGISKEQMWGLYIQLHQNEHALHGAAAHGREREERLEQVGKELLDHMTAFGQSIHDVANTEPTST